MNIGTKGISLKFGLIVLALGIVGYLAINKEGEHGVHPVLVQTPQPDAEHLKQEKGRSRVLLENLPKLRHRNVKLIGSVL